MAPLSCNVSGRIVHGGHAASGQTVSGHTVIMSLVVLSLIIISLCHSDWYGGVS